MSRTVPLSFRGRNIWVWDSSLTAWLVAFVELVAEESMEDQARLARFVSSARVVATVGDFALDIDKDVPQSDVDLFVRLAASASTRVRATGSIDWATLAEKSLADAEHPNLGRLGTPRNEASSADVASV